MKKVYDVRDVINAEITLSPIKCRYCGSLEVTFNQYIRDASCGTCGKWQIGEGKEKKSKIKKK
jgi:ribosomal protein S27E